MAQSASAVLSDLAPGRSWRAYACLGLLLLMLTGCKAVLYSKLTESDANDMLYVLLQGGVSAEKRTDAEAGYSVWADQDEVAKAIGLLKANAQPEQKYPSLGDLFGRNQLISTPVEERIRFIYGMEQALSQTLSKIDGVLVARVHIVLPANDPLSSEVKPSSASVFIKHRGGQDIASSVPAIKDLVVRSIEGLSVDRVAVTLFAANGVKPGVVGVEAALGSDRFLGLAVPTGSVGGLWLRFGLLAALAAVVGVVLRGLFKGGKPGAGAAGSRASQLSSRG